MTAFTLGDKPRGTRPAPPVDDVFIIADALDIENPMQQSAFDYMDVADDLSSDGSWMIQSPETNDSVWFESHTAADARDIKSIDSAEILEFLHTSDSTVKAREIADAFDQPISTVRDRLRALVDSGDVQRRKISGNTVLYAPAPDSIPEYDLLDDRAREYLLHGVVEETEANEISRLHENCIGERLFTKPMFRPVSERDVRLVAARAGITSLDQTTYNDLIGGLLDVTDRVTSPFDVLYPEGRAAASESLSLQYPDHLRDARTTLGLTQSEVAGRIADAVQYAPTTLQQRISDFENKNRPLGTDVYGALLSIYRDEHADQFTRDVEPEWLDSPVVDSVDLS